LCFTVKQFNLNIEIGILFDNRFNEGENFPLELIIGRWIEMERSGYGPPSGIFTPYMCQPCFTVAVKSNSASLPEVCREEKSHDTGFTICASVKKTKKTCTPRKRAIRLIE
jgi:hypothetical protein